MNTIHHTRTIAAAAAVTLLAGLGTAATTATSEAQTAPSPAKAKYAVTATVSDTEPEKGDKVTIRGSVTPGEKGAKVVLQKRYGTKGEWKKTDTDTLNSKGKFKFRDKVGSVRFRQYRVLKPADGSTKAGKSNKLGVTVFGWRDLTSLNPVSSVGTGETGSVTINATAYAQSIVGNKFGNSGSIAYNINRGCKRFEGQAGLSDGSALTASGAITVLGRHDRAVLQQLRPGPVRTAGARRHRRLPDHRRLDLVQHRGDAGGPVRGHHRPRVSAFALQLLSARRTVERCDV